MLLLFIGTVSVTYLVCFAMKNAITWGVHLDLHDTSSPIYVNGKLSLGQTIRIYHECEGGIEKSIPMITVWHHKGMDGRAVAQC